MPDTPQAPATDDQLPRKRPTLTHYLMVLPAVALFSIFITLPAIQGVVFSFTNFAGYGEWRWIGWANYRAMVLYSDCCRSIHPLDDLIRHRG